MADDGGQNDLIPIESQTRTIQTCFQQCLYRVPNFQRPYSWTEDQLSEFWDDVVLAKGDFFFGSTVTWVSEKRELFNDTYSIIDGQQRLTTSAILLSVVRDAFARVASECRDTEADVAAVAKAQAATTQKYLVVTDDDGNAHPVLTRAEPMFYETIQNPSAIPSGVTWNGSAVKIGEARSFFETKILLELNGLDVGAQTERLRAIRANALKARVIQVELASEEDGFLIFETLNTRGADLRLSDLVKNLLIRGGAANTADRETISGRWDRLMETVQKGRIGSDIADRFIWQSWNSRREAVQEPQLFKAISKRVGANAGAHVAYLQELETDAAIYQNLDMEDMQVYTAKRGVRNAFSVPEFVDSVRALAIFRVSVANSTIFALARKWAETHLVSQSQLIESIRYVENFHFQFNALTSSGSTGGTRARYNRFAVRLAEANTKAEVTDAIADLREKLRASLPARERSEAAFQRLFYAPSVQLTQAQKQRARKIFVAYVLMSFAKREQLLPPGQNLSIWSIEHIKPQAMATRGVSDPVFSIGNLTLLTQSLNAALADKSLSDKIGDLKRGSAYFDTDLSDWKRSRVAVPSDEQIASRAKHLAEDGLGRVWSL